MRMQQLVLALLLIVVPSTTAHPSLAQKAALAQATQALQEDLSGGYQPLALQTGPDTGSSFAAAVAYHPGLNALLITGTTYGNAFQPNSPQNETSGCFFATLGFPNVAEDDKDKDDDKDDKKKDKDDDDNVPSFSWLERQTLDIPNVMEVCSNVLLHGDRVVATGYAEPGGVLHDLYIPGGYTQIAQVGMVLDMVQDASIVSAEQIKDELEHGADAAAAATTAKFDFVGGHLLQQAAVTYPVAVTALGGNDVLYVASMETEDATTNADDESSLRHSMTHDPTRFFLYGTSYFMAITKVKLTATTDLNADRAAEQNAVQESLKETWRIPFATSDGSSVHVADLVQLTDDVLLVVGTTAGRGAAFGGLDDDSTDLDGFVAKLDPNTGSLFGTHSFRNAEASSGEFTSLSTEDENNAAVTSSARIQSHNHRDDWLSGVCHDPRDPHHVYLVGATRGQMDATTTVVNNETVDDDHTGNVQAFLIKLEVERLVAVWTHQLGATPFEDDDPTRVRGVSCTITQDGETIYYGGVVERGAVLPLSGPLESYGGDDVFVAKLDTATGTHEWVRQLGSAQDDELSMRGGLATDGAAGNVVLVGNTFGSFYRNRQDDSGTGFISDVFVTTISRFNGAVALPLTISHRPNGDEEREPGDDDHHVNVTDIAAPDPNATLAEPLNVTEEGSVVIEEGKNETAVVNTTSSAAPTPVPVDPHEKTNVDKPDEDQEVPLDEADIEEDELEAPPPEEPEAATPPADAATPQDDEEDSSTLRRSLLVGLGVGAGLGCLALCIYCVLLACYYHQNGNVVETDRSKVLGYLADFDVEDVDLRHSATGGWHCSYSGPLAHGRVSGSRSGSAAGASTSSFVSSSGSSSWANTGEDAHSVSSSQHMMMVTTTSRSSATGSTHSKDDELDEEDICGISSIEHLTAPLTAHEHHHHDSLYSRDDDEPALGESAASSYFRKKGREALARAGRGGLDSNHQDWTARTSTSSRELYTKLKPQQGAKRRDSENSSSSKRGDWGRDII